MERKKEEKDKLATDTHQTPLCELRTAGRPTRTHTDVLAERLVRTKDVIASRKKYKINDTKHAPVECAVLSFGIERGKDDFFGGDKR